MSDTLLKVDIYKTEQLDQKRLLKFIQKAYKESGRPSGLIQAKDVSNFWFSTSSQSFFVSIQDEIVGAFTFKENNPELDTHVAKAEFLVNQRFKDGGIKKRMIIFALNEARDIGFLSFQFDIPANSKEEFILSYQELGFEIIGKIEHAFIQSKSGSSDAFVMSRKL